MSGAETLFSWAMCGPAGKIAQWRRETKWRSEAFFKSDYEHEISSSRLSLNFMQLTRRVKGDMKKIILSSLSLIFTFFSKGDTKESLLGSCFYRKWRGWLLLYIFSWLWGFMQSKRDEWNFHHLISLKEKKKQGPSSLKGGSDTQLIQA